MDPARYRRAATYPALPRDAKDLLLSGAVAEEVLEDVREAVESRWPAHLPAHDCRQWVLNEITRAEETRTACPRP